MSLITSVQTGGSHSHQTTSEEANFFATDFVTPGVTGILSNTGTVAPMSGGYSVNAQGSPNMTVAISTGIGYVTATPTGQGSQCLRVRNNATITQTINANATGSTRYDFIYIRIDPDIAINPDAGGDDAATINVSRSTSPTTDNGTPPAFGTLIAVVTVANGASSITNGNIRDARAQAGINPSGASSASSWLAAGYTPNTVTANGNRSYSLVFNSVDLTGFLSPGMRIRTTRTTAAPTQCTSLNGTTQFYSKTSPAGMTFTDDFTVSAWVKLSAYQNQTIVSRSDGSTGWQLSSNSSGQIILAGYNGGAGANFSQVISYQSLPLNKWVHVAAQLDMSTFTATTTTSYIMLDGLDVPASVSRGGTNPTALVQAGDINVGRLAGFATQFFSGKIAQVAIFSAKVTQANVLATISQGLAGTETSLISAYSFNNSINDLNANANNLTATGSAVATNADSPFSNDLSGVLNYGIITNASFSTNTTLTVQVPEQGSIPTTGTVSAMSYSSQKMPYGFPGQQAKWKVASIYKNNESIAISAINTWTPSVGCKLIAPVGAWETGYIGPVDLESTVAGNRSGHFLMYDSSVTPSNTTTNQDLTVALTVSAGQDATATVFKSIDTTLTTATTYRMASSITVATGSELWFINAIRGEFVMFAKCAYL